MKSTGLLYHTFHYFPTTTLFFCEYHRKLVGQLFFRLSATNSEKEIVQKQAFLLTQLLLKRAFLMSESFFNKENKYWKKILNDAKWIVEQI